MNAKEYLKHIITSTKSYLSFQLYSLSKSKNPRKYKYDFRRHVRVFNMDVIVKLYYVHGIYRFCIVCYNLSKIFNILKFFYGIILKSDII